MIQEVGLVEVENKSENNLAYILVPRPFRNRQDLFSRQAVSEQKRQRPVGTLMKRWSKPMNLNETAFQVQFEFGIKAIRKLFKNIEIK